MFLYAGVGEIVADSARKFLQINWAIQLERSPATVRAEQAKAPTISARRHCTGRRVIPRLLVMVE